MERVQSLVIRYDDGAGRRAEAKSRMAEEPPGLESGNGECEDSASIICVRTGIVRYPGHR